MTKHLTPQRYILTLSYYVVFAAVALAVAPLVGSEPICFSQVLRDLTGPAPWSVETHIFLDQRLPRVLLGFCVGGTLALVGSVFQVILRNPLAAPSTLGVTGGGAVGAFLAISAPRLAVTWGPFSSVQLFALAGALAVLGLIYLMARRPAGISMSTVLLTGVTLGILSGAVIMLVRYLAHPDELVAMERWMMGGLDVVGYDRLSSLFPFLLPGLAILFLHSGALNHLSLGKEMAMGHGIDVASLQRLALFAGGLATASVVSLAGPIFFVGLIIPHAVRRISGCDHRLVLPAAFLAGGAFLVSCDMLARTIVAPTEMPVGIITALIGGPFFIYLLISRR